MSAQRRPYVESYRQDSSSEWVWDALLGEGQIDEGSPLWNEAHDVALEVMQRARGNLELIIEYLRQQNYVFGYVSWEWHDASPWTPPSVETPALIAELRSRIGPIPIALRAWWETIGEVNLCGRFEDAAEDTTLYNDALVVYPVEAAIEALAEWETTELRQEPFEAPVAPDIFHKANYSGGLPYAISLPDSRADAHLRNVVAFAALPDGTVGDAVGLQETFVSHLRRSFHWAGFPGYALLNDIRAKAEVDRLRPLFSQMVEV